MTSAQRQMLRTILAQRWPQELGVIVMECSDGGPDGLAWRNADRVAGALLRRGWIQDDGDVVTVTDEGRKALEVT